MYVMANIDMWALWALVVHPKADTSSYCAYMLLWNAWPEWLDARCRVWTGSGRRQMLSRHSVTRKPGCSRWMMTSLFDGFDSTTPDWCSFCTPSLHHAITYTGRGVQSVYMHTHMHTCMWLCMSDFNSVYTCTYVELAHLWLYLYCRGARKAYIATCCIPLPETQLCQSSLWFIHVSVSHRMMLHACGYM